ncbi:MAG: amidohydrolase family protein [Nannocystaceae bacterium]|nr:amidohydrolase family protein [Nannocystaceae bacterium]
MRTALVLALTVPLARGCGGVPAPPATPGSDAGDDGGSSSGPRRDGSGEGDEATLPRFDLGARDGVVLRGVTVVGLGARDVTLREGLVARIAAVGAAAPDDDALAELDARGQYLVPAFIDSHVHLAYAFDAPTLAHGGVAAAVDLAAPLGFFATDHAPLQLALCGPMITAVGGYPTQGWGAGGFGLEVEGVDAVRQAVDQLAELGARAIKLPLGDAPELSDAEVAALVERAHARDLPVVAHALADADASRAADAGVDVLAHTPVEPLSDDTVAAWQGRTVISTLDAFGGAASTIDNLRRLRAAGTRVLYGTDLGNTGIPGIDPNELGHLVSAGLDGAAILAAATAEPAAFWRFDGLGPLREGGRASVLLLDRDPLRDPSVLAEPTAVYIDGELQPKSWTAGDGIKD